MIASATAAPAPRPPAVEAERLGSTAPIPTPRATKSPAARTLRKIVDGIPGLTPPPRAARSSRSRTRRPASPGWAAAPAAARSTVGSKTAAARSSKDPLSFLKDPKLSIEEKLMRLLAHLDQKWEKEMQAKLDQIAAGEKGATTKASTSRSKKTPGGLLGNLASAASGLLGAAGFPVGLLGDKAVQGLLGKIGGPVLASAATALGFPALAPALLKIGPGVIGAIAGVVSTAGGSTGGASASSGAGMKDSERQRLVLEIQRIAEKQKEMFGLVSNILKANHDLRSSVIANIR